MTDFFTHESAIVESKKIGENTRIWAFVHILPGAVIGTNANICDHVFIENEVVIGNNVTVKGGVSLWDGLVVEDNVMIGPNAVFTNDRYPRSKNIDYKLEKIVLKKGASIGANATILAGSTIGMSALVGAGSVVTKDVADFTLVFGNPAQFKSYICICANKLVFDGKNLAVCACGRTFEKKESVVILLHDIHNEA